MDVFTQSLLAAAVLMPMVGSAIAVLGARVSNRRRRIATELGWMSALLAVGTAVAVALRGSFGIALGGAHGQPLLGLWADPLTATLLVLICGVGAVVQSYGLRYLQADPKAERFVAAANMVVTAMAVVSTSITVAGLVAAWVVAGIGFVVVVGARPDLPGVRTSARRTLGMFVLGDAALVGAAVIIWLRAGNVDVVSSYAVRLAAGAIGGFSGAVALLIVVAALSRSAQGPFGRWLPGTVSAPTPASALLHAGVVNGGGILLIRLGALAGDSIFAMIVAFTVAAGTAIVATALMTRKPDVKGALVFSTMGQMGFMIAECAVGAYLAALVHLVGHGMYKATLFFGSGSQVSRLGEESIAPARAGSTLVRLLAAGTMTVATVGVMTTIPGVLEHRGGAVLLVFTAATAAAAGWAWWAQRPGSLGVTVAWVASMLAAGALYGLVLGGLGDWIGPALPITGIGTLSPWWLLIMGVGGLAIAGLLRISSIRRRLVASLIAAGAPPAITSPQRSTHGFVDPWVGSRGDAVQTTAIWMEGVA